MSKRVVIVIGGNSLIKSNSKISISDQLENAKEICRQIIDIIVEKNYNIVVALENNIKLVLV